MAILKENPGEIPQDVDPLEHINGPYSHMRRVLWSVQSICLPDPQLGFMGDANAEEKARELVEKIEARKKRVVEVLSEESPEIGIAA